MVLFGIRRRRRTVINGSARQYQSKPICGGSQGRFQPAPYGPQGVAQALYGNAPPVRSDATLYNADYYSQGSPAPPAYVNDTNMKGSYSPVSINTYVPLMQHVEQHSLSSPLETVLRINIPVAFSIAMYALTTLR